MAIERTRRLHARELAAALVAALAGCTTGPDYRPPADVPRPSAWPAASAPDAAGAASPAVAGAFDGRSWWRVFGDPVLDGLVDDAVHQNLDLESAAWRIAETRAQRQSMASQGWPSMSGNALAGRERMSENGLTSTFGGQSGGSGGAPPPPPPSPVSDLFQVGFDATWELDLWGKVRRSVEAADADLVSAEQARGEAAVSLTAEIARTYLTLRGAQRRRAIVRADIEDQSRLLALTNSRSRNGFASQADTVQQQAQLSAAEAALPPVEQQVDAGENQLALLLGLPPGALAARIGDASETAPRLPPEVPVGLPGDLLRRRPDVLEAEAALHAATARIGVAQAQLFPSIELGAFAGLQSVHASSLTDWASRFWAGGAQVSLPLFEGGKLKAQIAVADAQAREAALAYRKTVLSAYHDANNALFAYLEEQRHDDALAREVEDARRSRDLMRDRYRNGFVSLIEVISAQRQLHQAELAALQGSVGAANDLVALYKALGGDWGQGDAGTNSMPRFEPQHPKADVRFTGFRAGSPNGGQ